MSPLMTLHPSTVARCQDGSRPACGAHPLLGHCNYSHAGSATCPSRPNCRPTDPDSGRHERRCTRPKRHIAGIPRQRSCPDVEAVSPFTGRPLQRRFSERFPERLGRSAEVAPNVSNELSNSCGADRHPPLHDPEVSRTEPSDRRPSNVLGRSSRGGPRAPKRPPIEGMRVTGHRWSWVE